MTGVSLAITGGFVGLYVVIAICLCNIAEAIRESSNDDDRND